MSRPFLVVHLRPEAAIADDEFRAIRRHGGLRDGEALRAGISDGPLPAVDLDGLAGIIVGGSPFDVCAPDKSPRQRAVEAWFDRLFDRVAARDFPFLGCCSGSGLLGRYCGAPVSRRHAEDVGAAEVALTEAGRRDPLLEGLPPVIRVLLGHKEACDETPPGCELLATNAACPVQMFRLGRNAYATQFHPEGDAEGFILRVGAYSGHGYFPPEEADRLRASLAGEDTPHARRILRRFVERYRDGPA